MPTAEQSFLAKNGGIVALLINVLVVGIAWGTVSTRVTSLEKSADDTKGEVRELRQSLNSIDKNVAVIAESYRLQQSSKQGEKQQ